MAYDGGGPEDDRGDRIAPLPHQLLGKELGLVVVVLEPLADIQIIFAINPGVLPSHGDGADVREPLEGDSVAVAQVTAWLGRLLVMITREDFSVGRKKQRSNIKGGERSAGYEVEEEQRRWKGHAQLRVCQWSVV